jgi:hypothetical protein
VQVKVGWQNVGKARSASEALSVASEIECRDLEDAVDAGLASRGARRVRANTVQLSTVAGQTKATRSTQLVATGE